MSDRNIRVDPRAKTGIGVEAINGSINDRALSLINRLNSVMGYEGIGTKKITDIDGNTETLALHNIDTGYDWQGKEAYYYQSSVLRLNEISEKLNSNLEKVKNDITKNITNLFDTLKTKSGSLDAYENALANAQSPEDVEKAAKALEDELNKILTSDTALNEIMNNFFTDFNISVERMNDEIFTLIDDNDSDFADNSTNTKQYILQLPDPNDSTKTQNIKLANLDALVAKVYEEAAKQDSSFNQEDFTRNFVESKFNRGQLKISQEMMNKLIEKGSVTEDQLKNYKMASQFYEQVGWSGIFETAQELYGTTTDTDTYKKLFENHMDIATPKYFKDTRNLRDLIFGKTDGDISDPVNQIFMGIKDQINSVNNTTQDLMRTGFDKAPKTQLQQYLRSSPLSGIARLDELKGSMTDAQKATAETQISVLIDRQIAILQDSKKNKDIKDNAETIKEIDESINSLKTLKSSDDRSFEINKIKEKLERTGFESFDLSKVTAKEIFANIDQSTKFPKVATQLYAAELREADKINTRQMGEKLPEMREDGTTPNSSSPIAPYIGPTVLSAVISKIGDELITKAKEQSKSADLPTQTWFNTNTEMLSKINQELPNLGASSAGEAFVQSLVKNFKDVLTGFYQKNQPAKEQKDKLGSELKLISEAKKKFDVLTPDNDTLKLDETLNPRYLNDIDNAMESPLFASSNFINQAGLTNTKKYLSNIIDSLDDVDYENELNNSYAQKEQLDATLDNLINNGGTQEQIQAVQAQIAALLTTITKLIQDSNNLDLANDLFDPINTLETDYSNEVKKYTAGNNTGLSDADYLNQLENTKKEEFKKAVLDYSNSLTDFENAEDASGNKGIENIFKKSLDDAKLDLDGNGTNDFVDIKTIINRVDGIAKNINKTFGDKNAIEGDISKQGIRRMILLMFVMSIFEASDWDFRRQEADLTKYMDSSIAE